MANESMFGVLGQATELRQRIIFTLVALIVYRLGTYIPVPGINADALSEIVCHDPQPFRTDRSRHSGRRCRRHQQHGQKEGLGDLRPARQTRHRKEREE